MLLKVSNMKIVKLDINGYQVAIISKKKEIKELCKTYKKITKKTLMKYYKDEGYNGLCLYNGRECAIILKDFSLNTIVHELLHAIQHCCRWYGIEDDEFEAYTLGYLVDQFKHLAKEE